MEYVSLPRIVKVPEGGNGWREVGPPQQLEVTVEVVAAQRAAALAHAEHAVWCLWRRMRFIEKLVVGIGAEVGQGERYGGIGATHITESQACQNPPYSR